MWDTEHFKRNHSQVVKELKDKGLVSAYHYIFKEEQGKESQKTFYLYRRINKGYHIDHCFINEKMLENYKVLHSTNSLEYSDHVPIEVDIIV